MGLGFAGLMVLALVTPAAGGNGPGRMAAGDVAADCEDASMNTPPSGTGDVKLTTDVVDGATVAPGDDIRLRLTWDRTKWSGPQLDRVLDCVRLKGGLDPNLSAEEQPADNDGLFEYKLHVPDDIRPGCDICAQGFVAGEGAGGGLLLERSQRHCFMSGPPTPPATRLPAPPVTAPPATTPTTEAPRAPAEVPSQVAGITTSRPATPPPAAPVAPAPTAELPRTGAASSRAGTAGGGLALALGGFAVMGGAGRRKRRPTED
jgi:hypothetical protein